MRRGTIQIVAGLVGLAVAALPAVALAALVWTMTVSPTTVTQGQATVFTVQTKVVVAGNIGCVEVDLPSSFVIQAIGAPIASNGGSWTIVDSANAVVATALKDPDRLSKWGDTLTFTITAVPTAPGPFTWPNHTHASVQCTGATLLGTSLSVTVVAPAPTPTPVPTPTPTPVPTATPTPVPTPTPTPLPYGVTPSPTSSQSPGGPSPVDSSPTATSLPSGVTVSPSPSVTPLPSGSTGLPAPTDSATVLSVPPFDDSASGGGGVDLGMGIDVLGMLGDPFMWLVPGATVAGPGLLVLLFVALQAFGALAWIPTVRRLGEEDDDPRKRRRSRPVSRGA